MPFDDCWYKSITNDLNARVAINITILCGQMDEWIGRKLCLYHTCLKNMGLLKEKFELGVHCLIRLQSTRLKVLR